MTGAYMLRVSALIVALLGSPAAAEVVSASSNGFHIRQTVHLVAPPALAYETFGRVGSWWNKEHTYSGKAENMSMALSSGGCLCERLDNGGGIEHMRINYLDPGKRMVLTGSLGPLLYEATAGVMDVQFERTAGGSRVTMDYRVAGFANGGAEKLAPLVDGVLAEQFKRYREFARKQRPER